MYSDILKRFNVTLNLGIVNYRQIDYTYIIVNEQIEGILDNINIPLEIKTQNNEKKELYGEYYLFESLFFYHFHNFIIDTLYHIYHYLLIKQTLPKLKLICRKLLPFQIDILNIIGINLDDIVIIDTTLYIETMYNYPLFMMVGMKLFDDDIFNNNCNPIKRIINFVKKINTNTTNKYIYFTRKNNYVSTSTRYIVNDYELNSEIKKIYKKFNYDVYKIDPSNLAIFDKIDKFKNATTIITELDSIILNLLFSSPSHVILINHPAIWWKDYLYILKKLNIEFTFINTYLVIDNLIRTTVIMDCKETYYFIPGYEILNNNNTRLVNVIYNNELRTVRVINTINSNIFNNYEVYKIITKKCCATKYYVDIDHINLVLHHDLIKISNR